MIVVGMIALTLLLGWVALICLVMAAFAFGGFDEYNIPAGIAFSVILAADFVLWWILVGNNIHLSFSVSV